MKRKKFYLDVLLKGEIVEGRAEQSLLARRTKTALLDVLYGFQRAAADPRIAAAFVTLDSPSAGWARLCALRRALLEFRRSGKPVYCFMESGGNAEYFLAAACDHRFMLPSGTLHLVGLSAQVFFLRELLDGFGVQPELLSVGEYKSAGEMFTRKEMSPEAREQLDALLDDYYEEFRKRLSEDIGINRQELTARIDSGPYNAREAVREGLLEAACYRDEAIDKLKGEFGKEIHPRPVQRYYPREGLVKRLFTFRRPCVAVIDVVGMITSGPSRRERLGRQTAGAETIGKFLDHALESSKIRAVLLRIDSPGGSGVASDVLWRKISKLRERKPVVASFGDVAASGGYYIASAASRIYSESMSITGSIGVLGGKFVIRDLIERLAIRRESMRRGERAEFASWFAPFSEPEAEKLQAHLQEFYREDFVKKVAQGRKMTEDEVDRVGRGRVWSGTRAHETRLLDRLGGPLEAVQELRRLAQIADRKKVRLLHYQRRRRWIDLLMPDISAEATAAALPDAVDLLQLAGQGILLWMPYRIHIR